MAKRRSPFAAILLLGICVFQLGLGGSGVFCTTGLPGARGTAAGAAHLAAHSATDAPTDASPCHGAMPIPSHDTHSHHAPGSQAPSRSSNGCQPMAACASGFVPAATLSLADRVVWPPATVIAIPIQVLASLTFPPEPPPPRA